ncbi:rhomboid family intramembrane serine protease [Aquabacterium humicola]|uniref:rhomboid family intramembrane serine protease n=1 Tax=Aquabacterium humicola TaxID=3237377 RepID=UPI002543E284|nr:rhomboid family intramembrane serine protease [Rubrivivax pictus]
MPPLPPVTQALMLICTAVFCVQLLLPSVSGIAIEQWFALWGVTSGRFLPWQPVTYAFLHGDFTHLFFNMFGLWMFGGELENLWGRKRYLQLLLASVLAAAVVQTLFLLLGGGRGYTVGASGALFGLLLSFGMLFPNRIIMPLIPPIPMKARTFVIVFGAIELLFGLFSRSGVAHFAHLGGMLGAWLMISYWRGRLPLGRGPKSRR